MPTRKSASKKSATVKKKSATKKAARKSAPKSVKKKAAVRKTAAKKAARKSVKKKAAAKKTTAATARKAGKKAAEQKPKASDFIRKPSHTPAIFKPPSKRQTHIFLSMEEIRDLLEKRAAEESREKETRERNTANATNNLRDSRDMGKVQPKKSKHHAASLDDILGLSPQGSGKPGGPGSSVPRKFQKYHKLLLQLRDHVREELNLHSNDTLKRSQKEDAGDLSISVDAGTDNFDRDFALSLLSSEQESLKEIEAAIQRIYDGTYGVCEVTGEKISSERLEAVPFTRFSLEGQRQFEMNSRKRVSRAGAFLNEASGETITFGDDDGDN